MHNAMSVCMYIICRFPIPGVRSVSIPFCLPLLWICFVSYEFYYEYDHEYDHEYEYEYELEIQGRAHSMSNCCATLSEMHEYSIVCSAPQRSFKQRSSGTANGTMVVVKACPMHAYRGCAAVALQQIRALCRRPPGTVS